MRRRTIVTVGFLMGVLSTGAAGAERVRRNDFGRDWVLCHPFTLMGLVQRPEAVADDLYARANLNALLVWKRWDKLCSAAVRMKLPWHFHLRKGKTLEDPGYDKATIKHLIESHPGSEGVILWDETTRPQMKKAGQITAWFKKNYPHLLVYSNARPCEATRGSLGKHWGSKWIGPGKHAKPPQRYTYDDYLADYVRIVDPDVLMVSPYPFTEPPEGHEADYLHKRYFRTLAGIRRAGRKASRPYWIFAQSFAMDGYRRFPSESDLRMLAFCPLAYGFTGIAYFMYGPGNFRLALLKNKNGHTPTHLYYDAVRLNEEILNVGECLRYLISTDVKFVAGRHVQGDHLVRNRVPWGLENFTGGIGTAKAVRRIRVEGYGPNKNALVGFFKGRSDATYFMVVNLNHGKGLRARQTSAELTVWFDPSVKTVGRLSRETGEADVLSVNNGRLKISLPGGTGDLFKILPGDRIFIGTGVTPRFDPFVRR